MSIKNQEKENNINTYYTHKRDECELYVYDIYTRFDTPDDYDSLIEEFVKKHNMTLVKEYKTRRPNSESLFRKHFENASKTVALICKVDSCSGEVVLRTKKEN